MTRALVVHHDPTFAEQEAAVLRRAGYSVDTCHGPWTSPCPVIEGRACRAAERADALVYDIDLMPDRPSFRRLVGQLRALYGDKALVLLSGEAFPPVFEGDDHEPGMRETRPGGPSRGVIHLFGRVDGEADGASLELAIEEALGAR